LENDLRELEDHINSMEAENAELIEKIKRMAKKR